MKEKRNGSDKEVNKGRKEREKGRTAKGKRKRVEGWGEGIEENEGTGEWKG